MFGKKYKKEIERLQSEVEELKTDKALLEASLEEERKTKSSIMSTDGVSSVTFEINNELGVVTKTRINTDIATVLVDNGFLPHEMIEDERAIQMAFIVIAAHATDQIISDTKNLVVGDED